MTRKMAIVTDFLSYPNLTEIYFDESLSSYVISYNQCNYMLIALVTPLQRDIYILFADFPQIC